MVCNLDEGNQEHTRIESYVRRMLRPLLEGMAICGHAIGSDQGYIYCRGEYPFVVELLRKAIDSASAALEVQY